MHSCSCIILKVCRLGFANAEPNLHFKNDTRTHMQTGTKTGIKGMKPILYVSPLPPPYGGIATWTALIFKHGLPSASKLSLVDTKICGKRNIFDQANFTIIELFRFFKIITQFLTELLFNKPSLIHLNSSLSSLGIFRDMLCLTMGKGLNIPVVSHFHGNLPDFNEKRFFGLSGFFLKKVIRYSDLNIVENNFSYQYMLKKNLSAHFKYLPNFIEDELFKQDFTVKGQHLSKAIFAGGITKAKGVAEILALARAFPKIEFHLYGKLHKDMYPTLKEPPANFILHAPIAHTALLKAMQESDFLLFPSYSEGFPLTVVEAMAMRLPVIATNVGALPEMIDEGKGGFLVPPGNYSALREALHKLLSLVDKGNEMGAYNREKAYAHYRYSKVIHDMEESYREVMTRKEICVE